MCSSSCLTNAGCLGPDDPALCGSCDLVGTFDPCDTGSTEGSSNTAVIVGVVVPLVGVVLLVLVGLGVWGCVVGAKKWREGRQGSFDISVGQLTVSAYVCACICVCMRVHVCVRACVHVCVRVCMLCVGSGE